ncbi:hypothetical protein ES708_27796 [subsurface metagenome]
MNQGTFFKLEYWSLGVSVVGKLFPRIRNILTCELVFQLHGNKRKTVQEQDNIQGIFIPVVVMELPDNL